MENIGCLLIAIPRLFFTLLLKKKKWHPFFLLLDAGERMNTSQAHIELAGKFVQVFLQDGVKNLTQYFGQPGILPYLV